MIALQRTSQHFLEGFSAVRDEIEAGAQARRESEAEMVRLREQLRAQATRLGAYDMAQQQAEALQRRSVRYWDDFAGSEIGLNAPLLGGVVVVRCCH
jgi:hypothetical protein